MKNKTFLFILLCLCLLISGCSARANEPNAVASTDTEVTDQSHSDQATAPDKEEPDNIETTDQHSSGQATAPEAETSGNTETTDRCSTKQTALFLYKNQVFFTNEGAEIYTFSADKEAPQPLLEHGHLLGVYGSALLAHDDASYQIMSLEKNSGWKKLSFEGNAFPQFLGAGEDHLLFGGKSSDAFYLDVIDSETLSAKRIELAQEPFWAGLNGNTLYYTYYHSASKVFRFCARDLEQNAEKIIFEESSVYNYVHSTERRILFYDRSVQPLVYDIEKGSYEKLAINAMQTYHVAGDLLFGWGADSETTYVCNLETGEYQTAKDFGISSALGLIENGYVTYTDDNKSEFHFNGQTYLIDLSKIDPDRTVDQKINEQIYAAVSENRLTVYHHKTKKFTQYSF